MTKIVKLRILWFLHMLACGAFGDTLGSTYNGSNLYAILTMWVLFFVANILGTLVVVIDLKEKS